MKRVITKAFPVALALAIAIGVLAELAFTRSKIYAIREALTESETAVVTVRGRVTQSKPNLFIIRDNTGHAELQTCPTWYRRVQLDQNERVVVTGEIIKNKDVPKGVLYALAAYEIEREGRPEVIIRTGPGKPPWASSAYIPK